MAPRFNQLGACASLVRSQHAAMRFLFMPARPLGSETLIPRSPRGAAPTFGPCGPAPATRTVLHWARDQPAQASCRECVVGRIETLEEIALAFQGRRSARDSVPCHRRGSIRRSRREAGMRSPIMLRAAEPFYASDRLIRRGIVLYVKLEWTSAGSQWISPSRQSTLAASLDIEPQRSIDAVETAFAEVFGTSAGIVCRSESGFRRRTSGSPRRSDIISRPLRA